MSRTRVASAAAVHLSGSFALIAAVVGLVVSRVREDDLGDARAAFEFDRVVDLQEALAFPLVAGVPDGRVKHAGVAQQRRPREEESRGGHPDDDPVGVLDDVAAPVEVIDTVVGLNFLSLADSSVAAFDAPRLDLFVECNDVGRRRSVAPARLSGRREHQRRTAHS